MIFILFLHLLYPLEFNCSNELAVFLLGNELITEDSNQELADNLNVIRQKQDLSKLRDIYHRNVPDLAKEIDILMLTGKGYAKRVKHAERMIGLITDHLHDTNFEVRIKPLESLFYKLQRKGSFDMSYSSVTMQVLNDVVGMRIPLDDAVTIDDLIDLFSKIVANNSGVNIAFIRNFHGENTTPYLSDDRLHYLIDRLHQLGQHSFEVKNGSDAIKGSGYTALHIGISLQDGEDEGSLEVQFRGPIINTLAELEHKFYQLRQNRSSNAIPEGIINELVSLNNEDRSILLNYFSKFINSIPSQSNSKLVSSLFLSIIHHMGPEQIKELSNLLQEDLLPKEYFIINLAIRKRIKDFIESSNQEDIDSLKALLSSYLHGEQKFKDFPLELTDSKSKLPAYFKELTATNGIGNILEILLSAEITIMTKDDINSFVSYLQKLFRYARNIEEHIEDNSPTTPDSLKIFPVIFFLTENAISL